MPRLRDLGQRTTMNATSTMPSRAITGLPASERSLVHLYAERR
jgi:hypothetical protein